MSITRLCLYGLLLSSTAVLLLFPAFQRSSWNKHRLYHRLLTGNHEQQLRAASVLVYLHGEEQLLQSLQSDQPSARDLGRRALEHLWFSAAGKQAQALLDTAYQCSEKQDYQTALTLLNQLVKEHPKFAEGWNRRASVYWRLGEWDKSMADSERALALNPHHYGAWQGLGICHLQKGNFSEACRCLRAALKIIPHDPETRKALEKCERLLRTFPAPSKQTKPLEIVRTNPQFQSLPIFKACAHAIIL